MSHFASKDFSKSVNKKLTAKGVEIYGIVSIPDAKSDMPFANASRGYTVNDNGMSRICSYAEILEIAE